MQWSTSQGLLIKLSVLESLFFLSFTLRRPLKKFTVSPTMNMGRKWDYFILLYSVLNIEVKSAKIQHAKYNIVYLITELYTWIKVIHDVTLGNNNNQDTFQAAIRLPRVYSLHARMNYICRSYMKEIYMKVYSFLAHILHNHSFSSHNQVHEFNKRKQRRIWLVIS